MSIVANRKAYHDYFVEEKFEAGLALEGWEVKAIRAGRAQLKEAYVIVKNAEIVLIGAHIMPLPTASTHILPDPTRTRKLLHAPRRDQQAHRQGGARRLHADAARSAFQPRPRQDRDRPGQGQEAVRQARDREAARLEPREAAHPARPHRQQAPRRRDPADQHDVAAAGYRDVACAVAERRWRRSPRSMRTMSGPARRRSSSTRPMPKRSRAVTRRPELCVAISGRPSARGEIVGYAYASPIVRGPRTASRSRTRSTCDADCAGMGTGARCSRS